MGRGRSAAISVALSVALIAGLALVLPTAASADSGTGNISTLPDSQELEGSVQIAHECTESPCFWFAEVSAYPAATECPQTFDASHGAWVGEIKESPKGSWTSFGHFSFTPEEPGSATLCLYVNAGSESNLVGDVTRAPRSRAPSDTPPHALQSLKVKIYDHGCRAHVVATVPDEGPLGEELRASLMGPKGRHLYREPLATNSVSQEVWAVTGPRGSYEMTVSYPGDVLWPAYKPVTVRFALRRCAR